MSEGVSSHLPASATEHPSARSAFRDWIPLRTSGLHIRVKAGLVLRGHLLTFLEKRQQVGVNRVGLSRGHAVRKSLVGFQRAIP
jgi:hypothetical protein